MGESAAVARRGLSRVGVGVVLLGAAFGYAAGVVGPAAAPVSDEFDVSLTEAGLMTSVFFIAMAVFQLFGAPAEERMGIPRSARLAGLLMGLGGLVSAVAPWFAVLLAGRALAGLGTGIALIACPVIARALQSALLLGFYGGGITTGLALSLFVGGELAEGGVDWRVNFGISAAIGFASLPFLFGQMPAVEHMRRVGSAGVKTLLRSWSFYRADLLFVFVNAIPVVVGAWLIPYLDRHHGIAAGVAGALGFVLFAAQTVARPLSAKLGVSKTSRLLLSTVGPALAAVAILALALDRTTGIATVAIVALGLGFGAPYAIAYQRIENQVEGNPGVGLAVGFQGVNIAAIAVTPIVGLALDHGYGKLSFILLAVFCALTGLASFTRRTG
jgi:MFS transporter, CP family, cyanate transporter